MSSMTYSTAGTYTDTTNQFQFIDASGVILNSNFADADVFLDGDSTVTVGAAAPDTFLFAGGFSGGAHRYAQRNK